MKRLLKSLFILFILISTVGCSKKIPIMSEFSKIEKEVTVNKFNPDNELVVEMKSSLETYLESFKESYNYDNTQALINGETKGYVIGDIVYDENNEIVYDDPDKYTKVLNLEIVNLYNLTIGEGNFLPETISLDENANDYMLFANDGEKWTKLETTEDLIVDVIEGDYTYATVSVEVLIDEVQKVFYSSNDKDEMAAAREIISEIVNSELKTYGSFPLYAYTNDVNYSTGKVWNADDICTGRFGSKSLISNQNPIVSIGSYTLLNTGGCDELLVAEPGDVIETGMYEYTIDHFPPYDIHYIDVQKGFKFKIIAVNKFDYSITRNCPYGPCDNVVFDTIRIE